MPLLNYIEMNNILDELNEKQKEACMAILGPSLVIAGAGSGKTRVLTHRIAYMISEYNIAPSSILAITFTNKAAKEMRDRLEVLVGEYARYIQASTFHSFCAKVLRSTIDALPDRFTNFQIIDDDDSRKLIRESIIELGIDPKFITPKDAQSVISQVKSKMITLESAYDLNLAKHFTNILNLYNQKLIDENLLDFDDLILLTIEVFEKNPKILSYYQNKYPYVLVDEFQDTSNIQYDLVKMIAINSQNLFIVGDEDQSIYSFRGSNINNIKKFMRDFSTYERFILNENYRSTENILEAANKLISHNKDRIPKDLFCVKKGGEDVKFQSFEYDKYEARAIGERIKDLVQYHNYEYKDIAILYRNNYLSRNIENELIYQRINYKVYAGLSFYKRKEVKDMLAYLRLIISFDDLYSFERAISTPSRHIGKQTIEKLFKAAKDNSLKLSDAVNIANISTPAKKILNDFFSIINSLAQLIDKMPLKEFLETVYDNSGYKEFIDSIEDLDERYTREENVKELLGAITETETPGSNVDTIVDFLDNVTLMTDLDMSSDSDNAVSLMTMHSSKGLEFKVVFLVSLSNGVIPSLRADDIEEERRLLYVAITRAKERLYLSYAKSRFVFGSTQIEKASPFIAEIGSLKPKESTYAKEIESDKTIKTKTKFPEPDYNVKDEVYHTMFGAGTIKAIFEGFYIVEFPEKKVTKKIIIGHPLLTKR